jgi:hypothetical protein
LSRSFSDPVEFHDTAASGDAARGEREFVAVSERDKQSIVGEMISR